MSKTSFLHYNNFKNYLNGYKYLKYDTRLKHEY